MDFDMDFDFANLTWVVLVVLGLVLRLMTSKPRVDNMTEEMTEDDQSGNAGSFTPEELIRQFMQGQMETAEPESQQVHRVERAAEVAKPKPAKVQRPRAVEGEISDAKFHDQGEAKMESMVDDFDLQKAVIMSEILTRKYDE